MASLNSIDAKWDTKFYELVAYKDAHGGSCNVPIGEYAENPQLGTWVDNQRTQYKKFQQDPSTSSMTQERIERLESIAFQWGVTLSAEWDTKFNELVAYKDMHGARELGLTEEQMRNGANFRVNITEEDAKRLNAAKDKWDSAKEERTIGERTGRPRRFKKNVQREERLRE